jgi:hypothetical protein
MLCAVRDGRHATYQAIIVHEVRLAKRPARQCAEFQKILDHRGIVVSDPIGALARWRLGRAFAMSGDKAGDKAKAKTAYQDFLTPLERCRPRHPDPPASQGGIRQDAVIPHLDLGPRRAADRSGEGMLGQH